MKTDGLTDEQLHTRLTPSTMTLGGMLTHLTFVEDFWLNHIWTGQAPHEPMRSAPWDEDADWDWHLGDRVPGDEARTLWRDAVERSRELLASDTELDALSVGTRGGDRVSLRWILIHLIEEYARHAGHADLLAESLDGRTGE